MISAKLSIFYSFNQKISMQRTTKSKQQRRIKTKLYDKRDDFTFPMIKFLIHQYYYCSSASVWSFYFKTHTLSGADPGFQVRGAHLKTLHRAEGGAKIVGVFRVKNYDFTPKNHIFSNFRGGAPGIDTLKITALSNHKP